MYKPAYQHVVRVETGCVRDVIVVAGANLPGHTTTLARTSLAKFTTTVEYISETYNPKEWRAFIANVKRAFQQRCILPTITAIEKKCTCDDVDNDVTAKVFEIGRGRNVSPAFASQ